MNDPVYFDSFDDFTEYVKNHIKEYLPEGLKGAEARLTHVIKNNGLVLTGMTLWQDDSKMSPNLYLNKSFDALREGERLENVLQKISDDYAEALKCVPDLAVAGILDFDQIKDKIFPQLVGGKNDEFLKDMVHTSFVDLEVIYKIHLGTAPDGDSIMSTRITDKMLQMYGISKEELHDLAILNMEKYQQASFRGMSSMIEEMSGFGAIFGSKKEDVQLVPGVGTFSKYDPDCPELMFVLTNDSKVCGAAELLNDKALRKISDILKGDFVILPSSIHEVIILPTGPNAIYSSTEALEDMVRDVNGTQVAPDEVLSDKVYYYNRESRTIGLKSEMDAKKEQESNKTVYAGIDGQVEEIGATRKVIR